MAIPLTTHRIIPKLDLNKLRDDEMTEYTLEKIEKINAINAGLPVPDEMLFENGEKMLFEDGEVMLYE
jgi:hypothetical protein